MDDLLSNFMDSNSDESELLTLLAVLAHPDDETFGMGGTLALYAQRGVQVHLVCATRGEAGEVDPEYLDGFASIADRRERELCCAAGVLGLTGVHFLNYRDSGMSGSPDNRHPQALINAPLDRIAGEIASYLRKLRPQVILTFDPIGGYRHPDHIAVHNATVRAFELAADHNFSCDGLEPYQPHKLYFQVIPRGYLKIMVRLMALFGKDPRKWGRNGDIDLRSLVDVDFPVHAVLDCNSVSELRAQAAACHASQGGMVMRRGIMGWIRRLRLERETYMLAYPAPKPGTREKDLFENLTGIIPGWSNNR